MLDSSLAWFHWLSQTLNMCFVPAILTSHVKYVKKNRSDVSQDTSRPTANRYSSLTTLASQVTSIVLFPNPTHQQANPWQNVPLHAWQVLPSNSNHPPTQNSAVFCKGLILPTSLPVSLKKSLPSFSLMRLVNLRSYRKGLRPASDPAVIMFVELICTLNPKVRWVLDCPTCLSFFHKNKQMMRQWYLKGVIIHLHQKLKLTVEM